jgi:hypothetical protein
VYKNYLAEDYADCNSLAWFNYPSLELKVGESAVLSTDYSLVEGYYTLHSVMFRVDPEIVDETALVESGYQDWGLSSIYGMQDANTQPWYDDTALKGQLFGKKNEVSPSHSYFSSKDSDQIDLVAVIHDIAGKPGVVETQLIFQGRYHTTDMPSARFSCSTEGIVNHQSVNMVSAVITALQPGETTITAKVSGGGYAPATATCKVTVVEDTTYGDINGDAKVDAVDALTVLQAAVGKTTLTQKQTLLADVDGNGDIDAGDALQILKYGVIKIDKFPVEN